MRVLIVGAGATGGYFGGRLIEAGRDATFLVRPRRANELAKDGLRIRSRLGDVSISNPPVVVAENLNRRFDLVLLSCKAYDLDDAVKSFSPAVGPDTAILPILNGMRHLDTLDQAFGKDRVLGGQCVIAATLDKNREIVHLNDAHTLGFGERSGKISERVAAVAEFMKPARFDSQSSATIVLDMWEKWVFLATLAGCTCLMRASIGEIAASPGGSEFALALLDEVRSVAKAWGCEPRPSSLERARKMITAAGSSFTASMLRDIENDSPVEADHIIGDLLQRGSALDLPLLKIVYAHLKSYEARHRR